MRPRTRDRAIAATGLALLLGVSVIAGVRGTLVHSDALALARFEEAAEAHEASAAEAADAAGDYAAALELAVRTHDAGATAHAAADPALLADPSSLDGLGTALSALAEAAGLAVGADGRAATILAPTAELDASSPELPEGRAERVRASEDLDADAVALETRAATQRAAVARLDTASDDAEAALSALLGAAHAHGTAAALPELASAESRAVYSAAVAALADDAALADAAGRLAAYRDAWSAVTASQAAAEAARAAAEQAAEERARTAPPAGGESGGENVEPTYIQGILVVNKTYGLPRSFGNGLTSETIAAFEAMRAEAAAQGLDLYISSGFRSYDSQSAIYNRYVANEGRAGADRHSARPGHSEHQTGLTFDLNTIAESFGSTAEGQWVADNAHRFGFIVRYPPGKEAVTGYVWEPWHLRYLGVDTATAVHASGLSLEEYLGITSVYAE
ncbi:M15 family metallopeptidase [Agromyces seonyuensis]|uniref:D-alanyl-D-alanine carboxypeptidase-like core domain-containing protein n=1 Tax=Agromyces seonyuensis TaxID=2662446 RepID=A0A6I4P0E9_9MICO|nr:M15 family metallopeptidase [Agromyces seonyuensis]MWB97479.1 hypothetical protein [Agromyces seonyuensis]